MKIHVFIMTTIVGASLFLGACKKVEGPGGSSSITGQLLGKEINGSNGAAEQEVTEITCTHANGVDGSILENSDYFLLNTPTGGTHYYVWYENTNWPGQDPNLAGRTGIKVTYSNSETNVTIANNTAAAISSAASSDFTVSVDVDIVSITNVAFGEVSDADEVNTPFLVDIANQGKSASSSSSISAEAPVADERVYIICGEEDFYSESVRTDENGRYQFKGLTKGNYRVYALSIDTTSVTGEMIRDEVSAEITSKKQVVEANTLNIVH